jgi:hypothetical protein
MTVWVHPEASAEFLEAIAYYKERRAGLGLDLAAEAKTAIVCIASGWSRLPDQPARLPGRIV